MWTLGRKLNPRWDDTLARERLRRLGIPLDRFFFSSRRRQTRWPRDWSSDVCSSDLSPNTACSKPAGYGGCSLRPLTKWVVAVGIGVSRPGSASAALGNAVVLRMKNMDYLQERRSEERRVGKAWQSTGGRDCRNIEYR